MTFMLFSAYREKVCTGGICLTIILKIGNEGTTFFKQSSDQFLYYFKG